MEAYKYLTTAIGKLGGERWALRMTDVEFQEACVAMARVGEARAKRGCKPHYPIIEDFEGIRILRWVEA